MKSPRCRECAGELHGVVFSVGMNDQLCEPCVDRMIECEHLHGDQARRFDGDGVGYTVWRCALCGYEMLDPC